MIEGEFIEYDYSFRNIDNMLGVIGHYDHILRYINGRKTTYCAYKKKINYTNGLITNSNISMYYVKGIRDGIKEYSNGPLNSIPINDDHIKGRQHGRHKTAHHVYNSANGLEKSLRSLKVKN